MLKLPSNFSTSIDELLKLQNTHTIFLSSWDKGIENLDFPNEIIKPAVAKFPEFKNEYLFSDELDEYKRKLLTYFDTPIGEDASSRFGIFPNGTTAAMIAIASIKGIVSTIRALLIAPTYFTYIKVLRDFDSDIRYISAKISGIETDLNLEMIKLGLRQDKINMVILTVPFFGTGISITKEQITTLCDLCNQHNCYLLIDYMYGGMPWKTSEENPSQWLWRLSTRYPLVIIIESLSKRVFLNGIKSATAISTPSFIKQMEINSVHLAGSMSYVQLTLLNHLMSKENQIFVKSQIDKNVQSFQQNYEIIKAYTIGTPIHLCPCKEGYFCLAKLSNHSLPSMEMSKKILTTSNVLTIPHDRYLYFTPNEYAFRVNLSMKKETLISGLRQLLEIYL